MIVVADSSPLVVLIAVGNPGVLPALFGRIVIPPEVAAELASPNRPAAVRAFIATPPDWLEIRPPGIVEPIAGLHAGEAAAIALARELGADRLIIDERQGRQEATGRGVRVVGTIGVLELAAEAELIDLEQSFEEVKKTDFWVRPRFLDERLALVRQRRQTQEQDREVLEQPTQTPPEPGQEPAPEQRRDEKHGYGFGRGK